MDNPHSTNLYFRGTGVLSFDWWDVDGLPTGLVDVGNAMTFTLGPQIERKTHTSMRESLPTEDLEITTKRKLTGKFTLDEPGNRNLQMFLQGRPGDFSITPFAWGDVEGQIDFVGANDQGVKYHVQLWDVKIFPTGDLGFISEDWGQMAFEYTVIPDAVNHPLNPYGLITPLGES